MNPRARLPNQCMRCNSRDVTVRHFGDVLDFKGLTLEVDGLAETICGACGLTWATDGQEADNLRVLRNAFAIRRDEIRAAEGLLTGEQIHSILDSLELTRADAAVLFGGGPNAFAKYVNGEVLQSVPMDRLLRLTFAFGQQAVGCLRHYRSMPLPPRPIVEEPHAQQQQYTFAVGDFRLSAGRVAHATSAAATRTDKPVLLQAA